MNETSARRLSIGESTPSGSFLGTPSHEFRLASRLSDSAKKMRQLTEEQLSKLKENISAQSETIENLKTSILKEEKSSKEYQHKLLEANKNFSRTIQQRVKYLQVDDFEINSLTAENINLLDILEQFLQTKDDQNEKQLISLKKEIEELEDQRSASNLQIFLQNDEISKLKSEIHKTKNNLQSIEKNLRELSNSSHQERQSKINDLKAQISLLDEQIEESQKTEMIPEESPLSQYFQLISNLSKSKDEEIQKLELQIQNQKKILKKKEEENQFKQAQIELSIAKLLSF